MTRKTDDHWIFCNESPEWKSISRWRDYVKHHAEPAHKNLVDELPVEVLYFIGWNVRRARKTGADEGEYKSFLRAVGGAGDSDWYNTKAEIEYAAELEALYLRSIPEFTAGDMGGSQEHFDRFVREHRERHEWLIQHPPDETDDGD